MFEKVKGVVRRGVDKAKKVVGKVVGTGVASTGLMTIAQQAHAQLPAGVSDGFTAMQTDAVTLAGYAGGAVMVILGLTVGLKLTKRFANKL